MVKIAKRGAQHPSDSSFQMKVPPSDKHRLINTWWWEGKSLLSKTQVLKYMLWGSLLIMRLWPNLSSGIICDASLRPKQLRVRSCPLIKSTRRDPTMWKHSVLCSDTNPEPESTTCTKNTEISPSTVPSASSTWTWPVTTEPQGTPSRSSGLQFWGTRMISVGQSLISLEIASCNSPLLGLSLGLVIGDIGLFSSQLNLEPLDNDLINLFKMIYICLLPNLFITRLRLGQYGKDMWMRV